MRLKLNYRTVIINTSFFYHTLSGDLKHFFFMTKQNLNILKRVGVISGETPK